MVGGRGVAIGILFLERLKLAQERWLLKLPFLDFYMDLISLADLQTPLFLRDPCSQGFSINSFVTDSLTQSVSQ